MNDKRDYYQRVAAVLWADMVGYQYRHFKGGYYTVVALGVHSETGEIMVIYQSFDSSKTWVRPLEMFNSPVDKEKYPDAEQDMRFEKLRKVYQTPPTQEEKK